MTENEGGEMSVRECALECALECARFLLGGSDSDVIGIENGMTEEPNGSTLQSQQDN